jgi:hypothetical protein
MANGAPVRGPKGASRPTAARDPELDVIDVTAPAGTPGYDQRR